MLLLFEDHLVERLAPLNYGKPTYALSCATERLVDLARRINLGTVRAWVRPHLRDLEAADYPSVCLQTGESDQPLVLVNARLVPAVSQLQLVRDLLQNKQLILIANHETIIAAKLPSASKLLEHPVAEWLNQVRQMPDLIEQPATGWELFDWPHDVVKQHMRFLNENLTDRLRGNYRQLRDGLFVAENVQTGRASGCRYQQRSDHHRTRCPDWTIHMLRGPLYLGAGARINEHAALKDGTCLGHTSKVGGEVECSILEPYSNKQHHGFLGHSYVVVGSIWVQGPRIAI